MPFIRGRYHINPTMGEALEAAREAEAALLALEERARQDRANANGDSADNSGTGDDDASQAAPGGGPVHRVEIEAAEVVPSHSGQAARGFVARVHRGPSQPVHGVIPSGAVAPPETHVFADHGDLLDFLHSELAKGAENNQ